MVEVLGLLLLVGVTCSLPLLEFWLAVSHARRMMPTLSVVPSNALRVYYMGGHPVLGRRHRDVFLWSDPNLIKVADGSRMLVVSRKDLVSRSYSKGEYRLAVNFLGRVVDLCFKGDFELYDQINACLDGMIEAAEHYRIMNY